ncbi:MAG: AbrB/MazE/SpoVT family DNA-binding domain-containing protein [Nitrosotalea sp.]
MFFCETCVDTDTKLHVHLSRNKLETAAVLQTVSLNQTQKYQVLEIVLQKQRSWNYKGINYYKYRVTIPAQIIEQLKLEGGENLDISVVKEAIVIRQIFNK